MSEKSLSKANKNISSAKPVEPSEYVPNETDYIVVDEAHSKEMGYSLPDSLATQKILAEKRIKPEPTV